MTKTRRRIAFLAGHMITSQLSSGGDIHVSLMAAEMRRLRPDWTIAVIAPAFASEDLSQYFERVIALPARLNPQSEERGSVAIAWSWLKRVPSVLTALQEFRPDLVHSAGDFFPSVLPPSIAKRNLGFAWTSAVYHVNPEPLRRRNAFVRSLGSFALQRLSFAALKWRCDVACVLNALTGNELLALGFDREKIAIVRAAVDLRAFPLAKLPPNKKTVLWVHRLESTKGVDDIAMIFQKTGPDVRLDIVGQGAPGAERNLREQLAAAGLSNRVTVHGYVETETLHKLFSEANLFISCSYEEGFGISIAEALSCGTRCIAYALPSHEEIFGDVITTVPPGDTGAFAACIDQLLSEPDSIAKRNERHAFVQRYSIEAATLAQLEIFDRLLDNLN